MHWVIRRLVLFLIVGSTQYAFEPKDDPFSSANGSHDEEPEEDFDSEYGPLLESGRTPVSTGKGEQWSGTNPDGGDQPLVEIGDGIGDGFGDGFGDGIGDGCIG